MTRTDHPDAEEKPLVTVGMLTYNSAETLRRALDSLVVQDYPNFKVVILDDASADQSHQICRDYAQRHPFITTLRNPENLGVGRNFAKLLGLVEGSVFIWFCPDDWWAPNYISTVTGVVLNDPRAVAAVTATTTVHWHGRRDVLRHTGIDEPQKLPVLDLLIAMAKRRNKAGQPVFYSRFIHGAIRTRFLNEIFPNDLNFLVWEPFILMKMAMLGRMHYIDQELFDKHISRDNFLVRHPNDPYTRTLQQPFSLVRGVAAFLGNVFTSPMISWRCKLMAPIAAGYMLYTEWGYRLFPKWQGGRPW